VLVADPSLPVREIAYLLGYAEHSSFHRAFRRWHGRSPRAHRASSR
jgi:AraC-like DNA-binding protein